MNETTSTRTETIELTIVEDGDSIDELMTYIGGEDGTLHVKGLALDAKIVETPVNPVLERLPSLGYRLDARIRILREQVVIYAESVERDMKNIARDAADGKPSTINRGSIIGQLDESITELNALIEERKMLDYVLNGASEDRA